MVTEHQIKLARDKFKEISGITVYTPDEGTLDDFEQARYGGLVAAIEAVLSTVEPVVFRPSYQQIKDTVQANINRMHSAGESHLMMARWLSADLDKLYPQPAPSVAVKALQELLKITKTSVVSTDGPHRVILKDGTTATGELADRWVEFVLLMQDVCEKALSAQDVSIEPIPQNKETLDQVASIMLQHGTPAQRAEAIAYASPTQVQTVAVANTRLLREALEEIVSGGSKPELSIHDQQRNRYSKWAVDIASAALSAAPAKQAG